MPLTLTGRRKVGSAMRNLPLFRPGGGTAISIEQIEQNIALVTASIPTAFWSDLRTGGTIDPEASTP